MTLQNSYCKNFGINRKLLSFNFRQNWPFLIASVLICLCVITIPTVLFFSSSAVYFEEVAAGMVSRYHTPAMRMEYIAESTVEFVQADGYFTWVLSCFFALVAGIISIRFLNSKVGVNFWHSVPVRRENLLVNDFLVYSAYFVAALTVNMLLEGVIIFSFVGQYLTAKFGGEIVSALFLRLGIAVLLFFFVYSVMLFAASLVGSDFMRFASGALILFYPLAAYCSLIGGMMLFSYYTRWDYYLEEAFLIRFSPIIRLFAVDMVPLTWYTVVLTVFFTFVFLFLAVFLYKRRKSECAGTPVIHRVTAGIIKYGVVTVATMLGGLLFYFLYYSFFWLLFGLALGAFFSFMIINSILAKSPKAMFKNLKGLAVFGGCFLVFFIVFVVDIFGFDRYVPKWNIREITMDVGEYSFTCDGDEAKEFLVIFDDLIEKDRSGEFALPETEKDYRNVKFETSYGDYDYDVEYLHYYTTVSVTIKRDFGFPVRKQVLLPHSRATELLRRAGETVSLRKEQLEKIRISDARFVQLNLGQEISLEIMPEYYQDYDILNTFLSMLHSSLDEDVVAPSVGTLRVNGESSYRYDLYASDYEAIVYALSHFEINEYSTFYDETIIRELVTSVDSPEALLRVLSLQYEFVVVYDWKADSYMIYEDAEDIHSVFAQCIDVTYTWDTSLYLEGEQMYSIAFWDVNSSGDYQIISTQLTKNGCLPDGEWIKN